MDDKISPAMHMFAGYIPPILHCFENIYALPYRGPISGIYFLCRNGQILYIGKSVNVLSRAFQHEQMEFDSVYILPAKANNIDKLEAAFCKFIRPSMNGLRANGGYNTVSCTDKEMLEIISEYMINPKVIPGTVNLYYSGLGE